MDQTTNLIDGCNQDFNRFWSIYNMNMIKEYGIEKRANEVERYDRKQQCRWFHKMDEWYGNTTIVQNQIPASATKF